MNRKILIWGTIGLSILIALVMLILNIVGDRPNPETKINFCDRNPDALACTDSLATSDEISEDMFVTLLDIYNTGVSEEFCEDYFSGNIMEYCRDSISNILPNGSNLLSTEFEMTEISSGIYDIKTIYRTENPAYTFRLAVVMIDGVHKITGLSYFITPPVQDLELTNTEINDLMVLMIEASDDGISEYCDIYFTSDAYDVCDNDVLDVSPQSDIIYNYVISKIATNEYEYIVETLDGLTTYTFTVLFEDVDGDTLISEISFE